MCGLPQTWCSSHSTASLFDCLLPGRNCCRDLITKHKFPIDIHTRGAKTPFHSTPSVTAPEEPSDPSKPDGSTIKLSKTQETIKWFGNQFNEIHGFCPDQEQSEPLPSKDKQSFVPDILEQIQCLVRDHMSDALINHHANQNLEWNQTVDLQQLVNVMSFACLDHLSRWAGLRDSDQFNSFARHSMVTTCTPTMFISSSSIHPMTVSPDLDLLMLDDWTLDQPECLPDTQPHDDNSVHSAMCSCNFQQSHEATSGQSHCDSPMQSAAFNQTQSESFDALETTANTNLTWSSRALSTLSNKLMP